MSSQQEPASLISYFELRADGIRAYCQLLREIVTLTEQIEPDQANDGKLTLQLQKQLPILLAHEAWLQGLLARIDRRAH